MMDCSKCATDIVIAMINNGCIATPEQVSEAYKTILNTITNPQ